MRTLAAFTPASSASRSEETLADALVGQLVEDAQVDRQPGHGGLGDAATAALGHAPPQRYAPRALVHKGPGRLYARPPMVQHARAPSAAAATLVAVAFALSTLERWLAAPPPPRAGLDDLAGHVRHRLRPPCGGAPRPGWSRADVPGLLPVRRHPQRAVAGARHRLPARRAGGSATRRRRCWRCCRPSPPACWPSPRSPARCRADGLPQGSDAVRPAAPRAGRRRLGRRRARHHRRRAAVGLAAAARAPAGRGSGAPSSARPAGARQRADRRRHPRAVGQRHAHRAARRAGGVRGHAAGWASACCSSASWWPPRASAPPAPSAGQAAAARRRAGAERRRQRRTRRRTLPPMPRGSSSTNSTLLGHL